MDWITKYQGGVVKTNGIESRGRQLLVINLDIPSYGKRILNGIIENRIEKWKVTNRSKYNDEKKNLNFWFIVNDLFFARSNQRIILLIFLTERSPIPSYYNDNLFI